MEFSPASYWKRSHGGPDPFALNLSSLECSDGVVYEESKVEMEIPHGSASTNISSNQTGA